MVYGQYQQQLPRKKGKTLVQSIYDVLRALVSDHHWRNESDQIRAHGLINGADPNYVAPQAAQQQQNLTPDQLTILQLQQQLAQATGQQGYVQNPNAGQQLQAAQAGIQPTSMASANPQEMRGYAYPAQAPGQQAPAFPTPQQNFQQQPQQMQQYQYPMAGPQQQQYQPVPQQFQ